MQPERILRRPEVQARVGLKRTALDELERSGQFPKRRRISDRACGWLESEVVKFIESRPIAKPEQAA